MLYCSVSERGIDHLFQALDFGAVCVCGRKVLTLTDEGGVTLGGAPTRVRLSTMVLLLAAARKPRAARAIWETRLFC